jgi:hypothetical protein
MPRQKGLIFATRPVAAPVSATPRPAIPVSRRTRDHYPVAISKKHEQHVSRRDRVQQTGMLIAVATDLVANLPRANAFDVR